MRLFYTILYYSILFLNIETAIRQRIRQRGEQRIRQRPRPPVWPHSAFFTSIRTLIAKRY